MVVQGRWQLRINGKDQRVLSRTLSDNNALLGVKSNRFGTFNDFALFISD